MKVCGLHSTGDVELAASLDVDAVGLVRHAPSPRHLSDAALSELGRAANRAGVPAVLVTVDPTRDDVERLIREAGLTAVQLCGTEDPAAWKGLPVPILRRVGVSADGFDELRRWAELAAAIVLDAPAAPGGTGRTVDTELAERLAAEAPCLLAGGLDGTRVDDLPTSLTAKLVGFDASSRLESSPGVKSGARVAAFVQAARAAAAAPFPPHASHRSALRADLSLHKGPSVR
ncbi:MAG: phosphoribosylanthranilate isomerase [Planctomycetota bacterium]